MIGITDCEISSSPGPQPRSFRFLRCTGFDVTNPSQTDKYSGPYHFFAAIFKQELLLDGYDDVIVGMHDYDGASANLGAAFIYRGSASGLSRTFDKMMVGHGDFFGYSVSKAGDVNGDGYGDVIVGAHYYDNGTRNEGGAFIYLGSDSGLSRTPVWATESGGLDARYGHSVSTAGDVTHDGRDDVIVGADWLDAAKSQEGRVYLYYGAATVPVQNRRHFAETFKPPVSQAGYISRDLLLLKGFSLSLYDLKGRCVWKSAGSGPAYVDRNIGNGTYFSQWTNGRKTARTKILLLR